MRAKILILLFVVIYFSSCQKDGVLPDNRQILTSQNQTPAIVNQATTTSKVEFLTIQLYQNATSTDATMIVFKPTASAAYSRSDDAIYFQGFGAVSLSSLSSDDIPLAINSVPLPKTSLSIGLKINAKTDGIYKLNMTAINAIPGIFEIWLMDKYRKDSLDFRNNPSYAFDILTADTNSYRSQRFSLVIRQNPALGIHLLNFTAAKATGGVQVTWLTENEANYTNFTVQRSTDNGQTYTDIDSLVSSGLSTYSYLDKTPASGTNQYRLKIQDLNSTITYSKTISLNY